MVVGDSFFVREEEQFHGSILKGRGFSRAVSRAIYEVGSRKARLLL
jgi:hypothetical protein